MPPSIWSELGKYLSDALPGGSLNPELTGDVNTSPIPRTMTALRSFTGVAPDELGISVFNPDREELRAVAEPAFWAGTVLGVAPGLGLLKQAITAAPRTVRNVSRVVRGVAPEEALLDELSRVKVPYERSASSSARGWVSPVSVGDMEGVSYPQAGVLSALTRPVAVAHTHPRTEFYRYAPLSPADKPVLRGKPVDMSVFHTDRETGAPVGWREKLLSGETPPQLSGPTEVSDYMRDLMALRGYSTDVPLSMRPSGIMEQPLGVGMSSGRPVKTAEPGVDLGRRFFFTMARPTENLPAVVSAPKPAGGLAQAASEVAPTAAQSAEQAGPSAVSGLSQLADKIAQTPTTRRTVLRGIISQALQRFMPKSVVEPVKQLAQEAITPEALVRPVVGLSPELRAAVYNMPYRANAVNWRDELIDRGAVAKMLLRYNDKGLVGEEGLTLKQALRQMQSEPEVYAKFKSTVNDLGNELRSAISSDKTQYMDYVKEYHPEKYARESRLWDQTMPSYKRGRFPEEGATYPMYDPAEAAYSSSFEDMAEIYPEFQDLLKGMSTKQAKQVWSEYSRSPEGKAALKAVRDYRKAESAYFDQLAEKAGAVRNTYYPYDYPRAYEVFSTPNKILEALTEPKDVIRRYIKNERRVPSLNEVRDYAKSGGSKLNITAADLQSAIDWIKNSLSRTRYDPIYRYDDVYKDLGLDIPVYNPSDIAEVSKNIASGSLSKIKAQPPEGFKRGGLAQMKECSCHG